MSMHSSAYLMYRHMASPGDLEKFRRAWRKELESQKEKNSGVSDSDVQSQQTPGQCELDCEQFGISKDSRHHSFGTESGTLGPTGSSGSGYGQADMDSKPGPSGAQLFILHNPETVGNTGDNTFNDGPSNQGPEQAIKGPHGILKAFVDDQKIENVRKRKNTLQPFVIAEDLLCGKAMLPYFKKRGKVGLQVENQDLERSNKPKKEEGYLDIFLNDLMEINEIPFFDLELPREVAIQIFKHLDATDLCRCAQVSQSWRSLAEDELLWCRICHRLGYEESSSTVQKQGWKAIVKAHIVHQRQLNSNWKNRVGECSHLQYVRGGILSAAASYERLVVAGYMTGDVKLWDLENQDECLLSPSNTALVLNENEEAGLVNNYVTKVSVGSQYTVGGYSQGNVDIWNNEEGRSPVYTLQCAGSVHQLALYDGRGRSGTCVAASSNNLLRTVIQDDDIFQDGCTLELDQKVSHLKWVPTQQVSAPCLAFSGLDWVKVVQVGAESHQMSTLHHVVDMSVTIMDVTDTELAFGLVSYDVQSHGKEARVKLYNLETKKELCTYHGHTWSVSALDLQGGRPHLFATGCGDKKVRVYDRRLAGEQVQTFAGHRGWVYCVQMDDWKVVSGGGDGLLCVWDQRMPIKLWEMHDRHSVKYLHFNGPLLITANIPENKYPYVPGLDQDDTIVPLRYRGSVHVYDFAKQLNMAKHIPSICLSTYDEPEGYNYNIKLAVPYDKL